MDLMNTDNKGLAYIRSEDQFEQAHRKVFVQDIIGRISGHNLDLLSFEDIVTKLRLHHTVNLGLQDVPLAQITGSCGRYTDFTRTFLPRRAGRDKERWRQIYTLATTGQGFPPIDVYKVDQVYFVKDGNHRVSVARELKWKTIQAYVTELPTIFTLEPDIQPDQLLIKEECAQFLEKTQLHKLRPEADIVFTEPGRYSRLLKQISVCRFLLGEGQQDNPTCEEAVIDWYDNLYAPMIEYVKKSGIMKSFPRRTPDDLLAWMVEHQKQLRVKHQMDEEDMIEHRDEFLTFVNQLTPWAIAKIEIEEKVKNLFGGGGQNYNQE